jgi:hypothetical protein
MTTKRFMVEFENRVYLITESLTMTDALIFRATIISYIGDMYEYEPNIDVYDETITVQGMITKVRAGL